MATTVVKGACPHDCPDTCAMLVTVEDGRAVRSRRRSRPSVHAGIPLHEGQPVPRAHVPPRAAAASAAPRRTERRRPVRARSRGTRRSTRSPPRLTSIARSPRRPAGDPAVLVRRHDGLRAGLVDGPAVLPPARRIEARSHDLLDGRHGGHAHDRRREHRRRRARGFPRATWCCCGARTR